MDRRREMVKKILGAEMILCPSVRHLPANGHFSI
jgi:hypothetical protein